LKTAKEIFVRAKRPIRVVFAVYDGVNILNLAGPLGAFTIASRLSAERESPLYHCMVVSARGGRVRTGDGVSVHTEPASALRNRAIDTLIVPGAWRERDITRDRALVNWARKRAASCRRLVAQCSGAFLLAEAGLLDGRRVTTHWGIATRLAQRYPTLNVEVDPIYIRDGRTWSSAGMTAGIDLALALIEDDLGREAALNVARFLVVYLKRSGGQSQYSALLTAQTDDDPDGFAGLEQWIAEHPGEDLRVEALAARVNMSPRNFARVYATRRGRTPAKSVEAIRVDAARRRLEESAEQIEIIARRCGFGTEEQMRCAFVRNLGIPPREYRKRFSANVAGSLV
jgi:transcriptional regulator GlxA family with amidase domain